MDLGVSAVLAALVSAVGGVIVVLLQKHRAENRDDHATVTAHLVSLRRAVDRIDDKVDTHLTWHDTQHERPAQRNSRRIGARSTRPRAS